MQLFRYKDSTINNLKNTNCYLLRISREEAIKLIASMCNQINASNPNEGRLESTTDDGEYFSISVICRDQTTKECLKNFKG
jgi:hypothetical protein